MDKAILDAVGAVLNDERQQFEKRIDAISQALRENNESGETSQKALIQRVDEHIDALRVDVFDSVKSLRERLEASAEASEAMAERIEGVKAETAEQIKAVEDADKALSDVVEANVATLRDEIAGSVELLKERLSSAEDGLIKALNLEPIFERVDYAAEEFAKEFAEEKLSGFTAEVFAKIEKRLGEVKDGSDGVDGSDGKDGRDGVDGIDKQLVQPVSIDPEQSVSKGNVIYHKGGLFQSVRDVVGDPDRDPHGWGCIVDGISDLKREFDAKSGQFTFHTELSTGKKESFSFDRMPAYAPPGEHRSIEGDYYLDGTILRLYRDEEWQEVDLRGSRGRKGMQGVQGEKGLDGKNGIGIDDIIVDGQTMVVMLDNGETKELLIDVAIPEQADVDQEIRRYAGTWHVGKSYSKGDVVTSFDGLWLALRNTSNKPGTVDNDPAWVLMHGGGGGGGGGGSTTAVAQMKGTFDPNDPNFAAALTGFQEPNSFLYLNTALTGNTLPAGLTWAAGTLPTALVRGALVTFDGTSWNVVEPPAGAQPLFGGFIDPNSGALGATLAAVTAPNAYFVVEDDYTGNALPVLPTGTVWNANAQLDDLIKGATLLFNGADWVVLAADQIAEHLFKGLIDPNDAGLGPTLAGFTLDDTWAYLSADLTGNPPVLPTLAGASTWATGTDATDFQKGAVIWYDAGADVWNLLRPDDALQRDPDIVVVADQAEKLTAPVDFNLRTGALVIQQDNGWTYEYRAPADLRLPATVSRASFLQQPSSSNKLTQLQVSFTSIPIQAETKYDFSYTVEEVATGRQTHQSFSFNFSQGANAGLDSDLLNAHKAVYNIAVNPLVTTPIQNGMGLQYQPFGSQPGDYVWVDAYITSTVNPNPNAAVSNQNFLVFSDYITLHDIAERDALVTDGLVREGLTVDVIGIGRRYVYRNAGWQEDALFPRSQGYAVGLRYDPSEPVDNRLIWSDARGDVTIVQSIADLSDRAQIPATRIKLGTPAFVTNEGRFYQSLTNAATLTNTAADWQAVGDAVTTVDTFADLPTTAADGAEYLVRLDDAAGRLNRLLVWDASLGANGGWSPVQHRSIVKATQAAADTTDNNADGDMQFTIEADHHEIKVWDDTAFDWVTLFSDDEINARIAAADNIEGTVQEVGGAAVGAVEASTLPDLTAANPPQATLDKTTHYWVWGGSDNYVIPAVGDPAELSNGLSADLAGAQMLNGDWLQVVNRGTAQAPDLHYVRIGGNTLTKARADGLYDLGTWAAGDYESGSKKVYNGHIYRANRVIVPADPAPDQANSGWTEVQLDYGFKVVADDNALPATAAPDEIYLVLSSAQNGGEKTLYAYDAVGTQWEVLGGNSAVTTYATEAALIAATPADGVIGFATDTGNLFSRVAGAWKSMQTKSFATETTLLAASEPQGTVAFAVDTGNYYLRNNGAWSSVGFRAYNDLTALLADTPPDSTIGFDGDVLYSYDQGATTWTPMTIWVDTEANILAATTRATGQVAMSSDTGSLWYWDGTTWIGTQINHYATEAALLATNAPDGAIAFADDSGKFFGRTNGAWVSATATATVPYQDAEPANPSTGQLFFDTNNGSGSLVVFNGTDWTTVATAFVRDTLANRPNWSASQYGELFIATDTDETYISGASRWINIQNSPQTKSINVNGQGEGGVGITAYKKAVLKGIGVKQTSADSILLIAQLNGGWVNFSTAFTTEAIYQQNATTIHHDANYKNSVGWNQAGANISKWNIELGRPFRVSAEFYDADDEWVLHAQVESYGQGTPIRTSVWGRLSKGANDKLTHIGVKANGGTLDLNAMVEYY